ncbi:hypothetical protein U6B65_02435 [Oscillospiraceae bacterium MB08-C2-2]|nr:hypothetical protein U6B65_02435 [Oscillospiraceae bacterium MB08-C2-2]
MNKMVERYIYDVTRRLSEKERSEVRLELEMCIADMLPDNPKEQDITGVLTKLGAPYLLAEQYRQNPRYLISPAVFELYISVLKTVTMVMAGVFAFIGAVTVALPNSIVEILLSSIDSALSGALRAVFWVTVGFAISERCKSKPKSWTVDDLPQLTEQTGIKIPRSSSIARIILSVVLTAWFTISIVRAEWLLPFVYDTEIIIPFSQAALDRSILFILSLGGINLLINCLKLYWARWNLSLCIANIVSNIVWVSIAIYILHWPDLLSSEFVVFTNQFSKDYQHIFPDGMTIFLSAAFVIISAIDTGESVWKTWKGMRE